MCAQTLFNSFGITGREFQDHFDIYKYEALAYQQPKGILLQERVELHWEEWCRIVAKAPWLTYWKRSEAIKAQCITPNDLFCSVLGCGNVPLTIYTSAVWGFGIEQWFKLTGRASRAPLHEIMKAQGIKINVKPNRKYLWDDKLYRGCGIIMPPEFGDLDRWLEPMWRQICDSSK